jgi:hypothetical protein
VLFIGKRWAVTWTVAKDVIEKVAQKQQQFRVRLAVKVPSNSRVFPDAFPMNRSSHGAVAEPKFRVHLGN